MGAANILVINFIRIEPNSGPRVIRIKFVGKRADNETVFLSSGRRQADLKNAHHYPVLTNPETNGLHLYVEISRLR